MMEKINKIAKRFTGFIAAVIMTASTAAFIPDRANAEDEQDTTAMVNEMAELINNAREEAGLGEIFMLPYLNDFAEKKAIEAAIGFDNRRRMGGAAIDTTIVDFEFETEYFAEGGNTVEETFGQLEADIMVENATHMGIGVVYDDESECGYYWQITIVETAQEFADQYIPGEEKTAVTYGDITGDGIVDTFDYIALSNYLTNGEKTELNDNQLETADCFNDGIISEADAKVMAGYILGEYSELPYTF